MILKVHLIDKPEPNNLQLLLAELDDQVRLTTGPELPTPADYQVLVAGRPERKHIIAGSNLRALIIPWSGIPEKTLKLVLDFPHLAVHNLHHNASPTAELAVALLLGAAKFLIPFDRAIRAHDWTLRSQSSPALLLEEKTALILGFGEIGQRVGRVCRALGMHIIGIRRHPEQIASYSIDAEVHPPEILPDLLPHTNVIIITLPLTPETAGMIGETELALMPRGGILVNVGRGKVVDQAALYRALKNGELSAAGLDVWYNYPENEEDRTHTPPADYPFHELDNVVMSPHRGGDSTETEKLRMQHLANSLNAAARGLPLPNQVDPRKGY